MNKIFLFLICLLTSNLLEAQQNVYEFRVSFKNKNGTLSFADSLQFLSQTALNRRSKQGISLDSTDLPIVQHYIDTTVIVSNAIGVHNKSKWFNQIVVLTYDSSKVADILALPIVQDVKLVAVSTLGNFKMKSNEEKKIDIKNIDQKDNMRQALLDDLEFLNKKEEMGEVQAKATEKTSTDTDQGTDKDSDQDNNGQDIQNLSSSQTSNTNPFKEELLPKTKEDRMKALQDKIKALNKGVSVGGSTNISGNNLDPYRI